MEKKKLNLWKVILKIILIVLVLFIFITFKKFIIINNLNSKVLEQMNNTNVYFKRETSDSTIEAYKKDNIIKDIIVNKKTGTKVTQITTPTKRKMYSEDGQNKTINVYEKDQNENQNIIVNYTDTVNLWEKIVYSITSKIKSETLNGKKCYVISGLHNINYLYDPNAINLDIYIEKETGLTVKLIETINENGTISRKEVTDKYEFNVVTDEDIQELNSAEYYNSVK